jgi:hypothetical protein
VGLQLYSLRDVFARNVPLGLQMARGFGFREVELAGTYGLQPGPFRAMLLRAGLTPASSIVDHELDTSMDRAVADARALGVQYLGTAGIPAPANSRRRKRGGPPRTSTGSARRSPATASGSSTTTTDSSSCRGGGTLFDLIVQETNPELVTFEMDVF